MGVHTFLQRQKAEKIYNNFFDPDSENDLAWDFFHDLYCYGAITHKQFNKLTEKFDEIGDRLYENIENFDKSQL